jgi:hypothetical protein
MTHSWARSMLRATVVSLLLVLSACVPFPHRSNLTPGVAGSVTSHGVPLPSASLRLVASGNAAPCEGATRDFKSTKEGLFYAPPIRQFNFFIAVMAHKFFPWALCIQQEDGWAVLHHERTYTLVDTGPALLLEISCDEGTDWRCEGKPNWEASPELIGELEKRNP